MIREDDEECSDSQYLFEFYLIQNSNKNQLIIFHINGDEIFNLQTMWFTDGDFRSNVCLSSDELYTIVVYCTSQDNSLAENFFFAPNIHKMERTYIDFT